MKVFKTGFVIIFAVIFSIACSTAGEPTNRNAAPAANANNSGPIAAANNGNQAVPAGEMKPASGADTAKVYTDKCALCHGEDGKGQTKGSPDFTNAEWQKKESDEEFIKMIKNGKKPMPAFGDKLSDEQIKSLVQYVRAFAKK
jgi:cytochrome c6